MTIAFEAVEGKESSTATGRAILADAVRSVDPEQAAVVEGSQNWRADYITHFVGATALGARGAEVTLQVAATGLGSMSERIRYRGTVLADLDWQVDRVPGTVVVHGTGTRTTELAVPFGDTVLSGQALRHQLADWLDREIIEPGFATAIERAIDEPEVLRLPGHQAVLVGAAAEMGPFEPLSEWGADVLAIDVPVDAVCKRLHAQAVRGSGVTKMARIDRADGLDVTSAIAETAAWIESAVDPRKGVVLGMYGYADGAAHVSLTAAVDAIATRLIRDRGAALAMLGTPTDSYLVPDSIMGAARSRWTQRGRVTGAVQGGLRLLSGGGLFRPSYPVDHPGPGGSRWGVADIMLPMQGPNYALAKRLQRWRSLVAASQGATVSFNVAPASWTRSVTHNKVFKVAYSGASTFGVEIFPAATARYLMAAKLAVDLAYPDLIARPHPEALMYADANHGGFWRNPLEPKSVLPAAAAVGAFRR